MSNCMCHDQIKKAIVFSTAKNSKDENFDVKLLMQYQNHYCLSTMKSQDDITERPPFEFNATDYFCQHLGKDELEPDNNSLEIFPINIVIDRLKGSLYYIKYIDGIC